MSNDRASSESDDVPAPPGLYGYPPFDTIWARLPDLPNKQKRLAETILNGPETIAFGSIREVATAAGVTIGTVVRFAKAFGFSGYQALQTAVRRAYVRRASLQASRDPDRLFETLNQALDATRAQHLANLDLAYSHLVDVDLDGLAARLEDARRILVCAEGATIVVAELFVRLLRAVGLSGESVPAGGIERVVAINDVDERDLVVGISGWLTFGTVVSALETAAQQGATTVAIGGSVASPSAHVADYFLFAPAQGAAMSFSFVATVAVVDAVIASVASRNPKRVKSIEAQLHHRYLEEGLIAPLAKPSMR